MTRPREIELKLEVPAGEVARLRRLPLLRRVPPEKSKTLLSVYFDTAKRKLRKHGLSLRVRRGEDRQGDRQEDRQENRQENRHVQTVKRQRGNSVGFFVRDEWERVIAGSAPDLDAARDSALRPLIGKKLRRKLKNRSLIALTVDQGRVETRGRSAPLHELELELKEGDAKDLFAIAGVLSGEAPMPLASRSKGEAGYALVDREKPAPVKTEPIALATDADAATAFQIIARACLYQLAANAPVLHHGDLEAVHQMRVALRRLRTAMSLFADMLDGSQTETMKTRLKQLTAAFGPARELDVFIKRVVRPVERPGGRNLGTPAIAREFRRRRDDALAEVRDVVASDQFRRLVLGAVAWVEIGDWTGNDAVRALRKTPAATAAARQLRRRSRKIAKRGARLAKLSPRRRHKLRVNVKKLRYACGFFAGAFPGKKPARRREKFAARLKRLQGALGDLNDIIVHQGLAAQSDAVKGPRGRRQSKKAFAAGRLAGREEARFAATMKDAESAHRAFAKAKPFWG